jgi:hypothetical protein
MGETLVYNSCLDPVPQGADPCFMKIMPLFWIGFRVLFGLFFIYATVMVLVKYGGQQPPETLPAASAFTTALDATGFFNPLLMISYGVAGLCLLTRRFAPLGLLILAPSIVGIACFHLFLTHSWIWALIWIVWYLILVWHYRRTFMRLWAEPIP